MLILPIKKQWFDMIVKGEKTEEYREIKPYYIARFRGAGLLDDGTPLVTSDKVVTIGLRNGYSKDSPTLVADVRLRFGYGKPEWGATENEFYFILRIVKRHKIVVGGEDFYRYQEDGL